MNNPQVPANTTQAVQPLAVPPTNTASKAPAPTGTKPVQPKPPATTKPGEKAADGKTPAPDPAAAKKTLSSLGDKKGPGYKAIFRILIGGKLEFSSLRGDILGSAYVRLSTYQHGTAKFVLNDVDGRIRDLIKKETDVEVELGFADGERQNVFIGKIYSVGRIPPDGTEVVAIDPSFELQAQVGSSTQTTGEKPSAEPTAGEKVVLSKTGQASFYGDGFQGNPTASGEKFDKNALTAAHREWAFGTRVRVTNLANNKQVTVKINDRGPHIAGRDIDLSEAAAKAIDATAAGVANVRMEVLGKTDSDGKTTQAAKPGAVAPAAPAPAAAATLAPNPPTTNSFADLLEMRDNASTIAGSRKVGQSSAAEQFVSAGSDTLKFAQDSKFQVGAQGSVRLQQSEMNKATMDALKQGDIVISRGNTVHQVAPGGGDFSGIVLDYNGHRTAFIGKPRIFKRSGIQLQSGFGATTVTGWNVGDKGTVGATVLTQRPGGSAPAGASIQVPDFGKVKMSDPLFQGSTFTWGDAVFRDGEIRTPTKEIMQRIVALAMVIEPIMKKTGKKWEITSWYRRPKDNSAARGKSGSRHLFGDAIDVYFPGMEKVHAQYAPISSGWRGGIAISQGSFIHFDICEDDPFRRWDYRG